MLLYSLCSKDVLIPSQISLPVLALLVLHKNSSVRQRFVDELYVIIKVVLTEYNTSTAIRLPRFVLTKTLMNITNSIKWTSLLCVVKSVGSQFTLLARGLN